MCSQREIAAFLIVWKATRVDNSHDQMRTETDFKPIRSTFGLLFADWHWIRHSIFDTIDAVTENMEMNKDDEFKCWK